MTTTDTITPRAWVGCLACYNEGRLEGRWIEGLELDTFRTPDDYTGEIPVICQRPGHEELWCFDTEHLGAGECSPLEAAQRAYHTTQLLEQADQLGIPAAVALQYVEDSNAPADAWPNLEDAFHGSAADEADYVLEYLENIGVTLPSWLHVDYRASFDELTTGMGKYRHDGTFWLFWN